MTSGQLGILFIAVVIAAIFLIDYFKGNSNNDDDPDNMGGMA